MSLNYKEIKDIFENEYDRDDWKKLLEGVFPPYKDDKDKKEKGVGLRSEPEPVDDVDKTLAKQAIYLGNIILSKNEKIAVYEVELSDKVNIVRNRRGIRDMLNKDWKGKGTGYAGAFIVSYPKGDRSVWRFSFVEKKDGDKETTATYLLGKGQECRTAAERFEKLRNSKQGLADVVEAFSVEALTKEFYKEIEDWFKWAKDRVEFPGHEYLGVSKGEHQANMTLRLITRLIFIWFLKEKGLVREELFKKEKIDELLNRKDNSALSPYYRAILQNLFFATLNTPVKKRKWLKNGQPQNRGKEYFCYKSFFKGKGAEKFYNLCSETPFVNGGLFENLDGFKDNDAPKKSDNLERDEAKRVDCFSDEPSNRFRLKVPDELFFGEKEEGKGIIDILSQYNFTLEENTPNDEDIALDPELLGCVFEGLLSHVESEDSKKSQKKQKGKDSEKKKSGSFYTPREIVDYMVSESLKAYLSTKVGDGECLEALFASNPDEEAKYKDNSEFKDAVAKALDEVKILDPACGSGAFPMGMLSKMIQILERVGKIAPSNPRQIYEKKLQIIQDCIYGVDIQNIAVQISKLRFFISLLCEQEVKPKEEDENRGIKPLPNLETKIVCADSLIKIGIEASLLGESIKKIKEKLIDNRRRHINTHFADDKIALREEDKTLRESLRALLGNSGELATKDDVERLTNWDPYGQNSVSPFFEPDWMFGISEGFDIVIGNPPYIRLEKLEEGTKTEYEKEKYETGGNIYCLFYERGLQLLKPGGHLCFITSNKWMCNAYGEKLREFFTTKTNPKLLIDFAGAKIFKTASVDTNILLFSNSSNSGETLHISLTKQDKNRAKNLGAFVEDKRKEPDNKNKRAFNIGDSWSILSSDEQGLKNKIENLKIDYVKRTKTLEKLIEDKDIEINYGIKTGYDPAFHISTEKLNEVLANCKSEEERERTAKLIQRCLKGEDIKRYWYNRADRWLIATFPARHYDIDQYPAVKKHLLSFGRKRLEQTGETHIINGEKIKARKKTNNKWFEVQDTIGYWKNFGEDKPKILYEQFQGSMKFAYEEGKEIYLSSNGYIITCERYPIKCLLGFLNSKVMEWLLGKLTGSLSGNAKIAQKSAFKKLSVPILEDADIKKFEDLVEKRMAGKASDSDIDRFIYNFYGLNSNEIEIIESQTS